MQPADSNPRALCQILDSHAFYRGNVGHGFRNRERRDFDHVVTRARREIEPIAERPALEDFIADAEFHRTEHGGGVDANEAEIGVVFLISSTTEDTENTESPFPLLCFSCLPWTKLTSDFKNETLPKRLPAHACSGYASAPWQHHFLSSPLEKCSCNRA